MLIHKIKSEKGHMVEVNIQFLLIALYQIHGLNGPIYFNGMIITPTDILSRVDSKVKNVHN